MALSPDAAALTDDYRRRQAQLSAYMLTQLGQLWPKLDPSAIEDTRGPWLRAVGTLVAHGYTASATLAAAYLPQYRALERAPGALPHVPLSVPDLDRIIGVQAYLGPIRHYERLRGGMDRDESWRISRNQTLAAGQQHTANGGREQTAATVARDKAALGYARVASASACAFCAMLASRGPVYKAARSASFETHPGCNCTSEPVYHDSPDAWPARSRIYAAQWQEVTKGLSGQDKAVAFRRAHEGRAARGDRPATGGGRTVDAANTASGRGRVLGRTGAPVDAKGKRIGKAPLDDAAAKAHGAEAQLGALRKSLARLEARQAAGEDVGTALKWQRDRITALEGELGPDVAARVAADTADAATSAAATATREASAHAAEIARAEAQVARRAAQADAETTAQARAAEAELVATAEQARAAEATRAVDEGLELAVDDAGVPYRLTIDYLRFVEEEDPELETLVDYLAGRLDDGNPLELDRWADLELALDYRQAERTILEGAQDRTEEETSRLLAQLARDRGRVGLTHDAADVELLDEFAAAPTSRPTRKQVQADYAVFVEELYVKAEAATRGQLVNPKGRAAGIDGRSLFTGDVRRVLRYGSEELLQFFEGTRRVQWSEFYAERTGSEAFASAAARQRRISEGISRDRNVIDLVTNREA